MISKNIKQKVEDYIHYHQKMMIDDSLFMERLIEWREDALSIRIRDKILNNILLKIPLHHTLYRIKDKIHEYELN